MRVGSDECDCVNDPGEASSLGTASPRQDFTMEAASSIPAALGKGSCLFRDSLGRTSAAPRMLGVS